MKYMLKITFFSFVWVYYSTRKMKSKYYISYEQKVNKFFEKSWYDFKATEGRLFVNLVISIITEKIFKKFFLNVFLNLKQVKNLKSLKCFIP